MRILGIESSCDETAIALVVKTGERFVVEKSVLASQVKTHALYGGVVPEVAAREHAEHVFPLLEEVGVRRDGEGIDAVAVTAGPGLIPALRVGVELGKSLAWAWGKPLVAVNHLEGHIYSVVARERSDRSNLRAEIASSSRQDGTSRNDLFSSFPALCLLVSGGHTELILMKDHGVYELIGMTRDDAAGEAFDKVAKLLGLPYPGGPEISRLAELGDPAAIDFPRPMMDSKDFDFSFSGLKTAVRREVGDKGGQGRTREDIAASFQQAVVDTLVTKTLRAAEKTRPQSIILTGGVAANRLLREMLGTQAKACGYRFFAPDLSLTGDNAVMIAIAGAFRFEAGHTTDPLTLVADANMRLA